MQEEALRRNRVASHFKREEKATEKNEVAKHFDKEERMKGANGNIFDVSFLN